MKLGFIGVGKMGAPMCRNLIKHGYQVIVHDTSVEAAARLEGATSAGSPQAVASQAEVVFTCLPYPHVVEQVALGENGIAAGIHDGLIAVDFSTNDPALARKIAAELGKRRVPFLDAPVAGGVPGAEAGTISVMVGGDKAAFDRVLPLFQAVGKNIFHVGESGAGCIFKILNNLLGFCNIAAANEAFMVISRLGLSPDKFLEVIENSSGGSHALERHRRKILPGDFTAEFTLELAYKDLGLALKLGDEAGVPLQFAGLLKNIMTQGRAIGLGHEDLCTIMRVIEHNVRHEVRSRKV
jgi:3-hydroxyisobutyrate dehydrogenase-like beta-hydroxyacid dehydrogenase